jgi:hypothetical protein
MQSQEMQITLISLDSFYLYSVNVNITLKGSNSGALRPILMISYTSPTVHYSKTRHILGAESAPSSGENPILVGLTKGANTNSCTGII